jgi:hypothetical protein
MLPALDLSQQHILPSFTRFNTILHYVTSLRFITTTHFTFIYPLQYNFTLCYQPQIYHNNTFYLHLPASVQFYIMLPALDLSQQHILPSFTRFKTILHYVTSLRFITTTHFTFIYPLQYNFTLCYQP